jgi:tetratricopeptide (TPR) repeat protein
MLVITRLIEHDPAALEHAAERALETARRLRHARGEAEALFWLSLAIVIGPATVEDALLRYERMLAEAPGPLGEAGILTFAGWGHAMLRDPDEGRLLVRRGRERFRELGFVLYAESSAHAEAAVELHMGDLDAAERVLREGSAVLEAVGETASLANQKGLLAWILARTGRADEALELAAQSSRIAAARVAHAYWRRGRSLALAHTGEHEEALAVAREAVGVIAATGDMHTHAEMLENLAEVAAMGGEHEEGLGALEQAAALFERKGCIVCAARTRERAAS